MLCDTTSNYPSKIDDMLFFQDNDLVKIEIINHYENLIAQGKYNEANDYIENQQGVYGYFADFFNALENRISSLQDYLSTKEKKNFFIFSDDGEEPEEVNKDTIWI